MFFQLVSFCLVLRCAVSCKFRRNGISSSDRSGSLPVPKSIALSSENLLNALSSESQVLSKVTISVSFLLKKRKFQTSQEWNTIQCQFKIVIIAILYFMCV